MNERPSLARKHTKGTEAKRHEDLDKGVRITISGDDGQPEIFEVRVGDVTPAIAAELRRNTGFSFRWLITAMTEDPDIDLLTAFEWLARRVRGENDVQLADVEFTYEDMASDDFDMEELDGSPEPVGPEDPEA